ncbi:MAG: DNA-binding protein HU-beta [Rickettsiales bacterium]
MIISLLTKSTKKMSVIQKSDLIKQVAASTGNTVKDTESTINALLATIRDSLKSNDKIQFTGFGSFNAKNVPARKGRNPATGAEIEISARRQVTFSVGKELKDTVNS